MYNSPMKSIFVSILLYASMFTLSLLFHMTETSILSTTNPRIKASNYRKSFINNTIYLKDSYKLMMTIVLLLELILDYFATLTMENIISEVSPNTIVQLGVLVFFIVKNILLSMVFKTIAVSYCDTIAIYTSQFFLPFFIIFKFIGNIIMKISDFLIRQFAGKYDHSNNFNNKIREILFMIQDSNTSKEIEEVEIAQYFLSLYQLQIKQIMIQISEFPLIELPEDQPIQYIDDRILKYALNHDYVIIWQEDINNIIGVICIKDYLIIKQSKNYNLNTLLKEPKFILSSLTADRCLEWFKKENTEILCVVNSLGDFCGVITFDHITKEIFHYDQNKNIIPINDNEVLILGNINIRNINRKMDWEIPYDHMSISGLFTYINHSLPIQNQKIIVENYGINLKEVTNGKIQKVHISRISNEDSNTKFTEIEMDQSQNDNEEEE
jgi:putative hemolysin